MNRELQWMRMWQRYMDFMHEHARRPSKYEPAERELVNWIKHNRKQKNQHVLPDNRRARFDELLAEAAKYQRVNQYEYVSGQKARSDE